MISKYAELLKEVKKEHLEVKEEHLNDRVLIVDGLNQFIRVFGAVPALNDDGEHCGGITGFLLSTAATIRIIKPTRVVVVFDGKGEDDYIGGDFSDVECLLTGVDAPSTVWAQMLQTSSADGQQEFEFDGISVSWGYHPNSGLDTTFVILD